METTLVENTTTIVEPITVLNTTVNIETLKTDVNTKTTKSKFKMLVTNY